jgi:hypothetical protein
VLVLALDRFPLRAEPVEVVASLFYHTGTGGNLSTWYHVNGQTFAEAERYEEIYPRWREAEQRI